MITDDQMPDLPAADLVDDRNQPLYCAVEKVRSIQREAYKAGMLNAAAMVTDAPKRDEALSVASIINLAVRIRIAASKGE